MFNLSNYNFQYEFKYKTFIPNNRVSNSIMLNGAYGWGASVHGDGRGFSYSSDKYRTQTVVLARFFDGGSSAELEDKSVHESILYVPGESPKYDTASSSGISMETLYSSENSLVFTVNHSVGIPFKTRFGFYPPAIDYWYVASLHLYGDVTVTGAHDQAPSHELYLTRRYTDIPRVAMVRDENLDFWALGGYTKSFKYYY